jgi:hypothetical protein
MPLLLSSKPLLSPLFLFGDAEVFVDPACRMILAHCHFVLPCAHQDL